VDFEVLHPREQDLENDPTLRYPNAHSCVLRIQGQGGAVALLPGDLEAPQELRLVREAAPSLRADLLLVPHHGSRTSSTEAWLAAVQPKLALVQAGYRNRYGHPAAPVMARYAARGIAVVATPSCGAARWVSSQPDRVQCQRLDAPRYWWHRPVDTDAASPGSALQTGRSEQR
jgi:competence protein ComEC